jgi:hypothetical protein
MRKQHKTVGPQSASKAGLLSRDRWKDGSLTAFNSIFSIADLALQRNYFQNRTKVENAIAKPT